MPQKSYLLILAVLGLINGVVLLLFFLFGAKKRQQHIYFLAGLFLALTIKISKSIVFQLQLNDGYIQAYLAISILAGFLIGPLMYLYILYYIGVEPKYTKWQGHLVLNTIFIISILFVYPYWDYTDLWREKIIFLLYLQRIAYLLITGIMLYKMGMIPLLIKGCAFRNANWLKGVYWGMVLLWIGSTIILLGYGTRLVTMVLFLFMLYSLLVILINSSNANQLILYLPKAKYGGKLLNGQDLPHLLQKLTDRLAEEEIYTDPNLKIKDIAKLLNIPSRQLSQVINEKLNKNFNQYINEFRINKAKELILENRNYTLEAIGNESGFKSKSTFFSAFKKHTGKTPNEFKKEVK